MFQHFWMMLPIGLIGLFISVILIIINSICSLMLPPPISDYYEEDAKPNKIVFSIFLFSSVLSLLGCCFY